MRILLSLTILSILIFSLSCKTTTENQTPVSESEQLQEEFKEKPQSINNYLKTKMNEMLSFISKNCGKIEGIHPSQDPCNYNLKIRLPKIEIKSAEEIKSIGNYSFYFQAMYQYAKETILIDDKYFDQDNPKTWENKLGLIMHELYHHIQHVNDDLYKNYKCHSDIETPAYKVQLAYKTIELDEKLSVMGSFLLEVDEKMFLVQGVKCINETHYKWYKGEYKEGKYNGQGTFNYLFGTIYEGEWKDGKKHGQGTLTSHSGDKYVGEFKYGERSGQGTYTWSNGDKYEGEWKDEKKHGQGTETFPDGGKYDGEFKDGKKNGQGTRTWSDGSKYVGKFKDGLPNGKGKNTYTGGGWYEGSWKEGQSWTGITFDKDGNISYEKVNGKIQFKE